MIEQNLFDQQGPLSLRPATVQLEKSTVEFNSEIQPETVQPASSITMQTCPKCQAKVYPGRVNCPKCGRRLNG